jgi:trans-enoyl reductase
MSQVEREFDIIVYGASGFTGTLVAKYALKHLSEDKVALAGRNLRKLEHPP